MENFENEIKTLIPFLQENFLAFPLWEEGDYSLVMRLWLSFDMLPQDITYDIEDKPLWLSSDVYVIATYNKTGLELDVLGEKIKTRGGYIVAYEIGCNTNRFPELPKLVEAAKMIVGHYKRGGSRRPAVVRRFNFEDLDDMAAQLENEKIPDTEKIKVAKRLLELLAYIYGRMNKLEQKKESDIKTAQIVELQYIILKIQDMLLAIIV